ncbi:MULTISPECIES: hypothetical protein [unclassified Rhodococcus (in: high G+C Gram-positive bacteria)]|uniref:hypothetical protein n=1 Tax=unclassified Rhodococcus (in: high G+C Gram-positive bacteria) TaxID=192944 RepID=UPI00211C34DA|nr:MULTISPECIES: hypothetical protein [unclassified Rhodococcus (in: high G+C Gram-positive bacteria)]
MEHNRLWPIADRASRMWWRTAGRPVDLGGDHAWLTAPTSAAGVVRDHWLPAEAERLGGALIAADADAGLLPDMECLAGPGFDPERLDPAIRDFYEHTSQWRMEIWTKWSPLFAPAGSIIGRLYGKRVQQLALPVDPLAAAHGVDTTITKVVDGEGNHAGSAWLRTLRGTGDFMYSGYYRSALLPGHDRPSIHVSFPLEHGNVQVFLRPQNGPDGSLLLESPAGEFGADGAYVTVLERGRHYAARVPIREEFRIYVDTEGVLRTDHVLRMWRRVAMRLHYRLDRVSAPREAPVVRSEATG